ncbi:MAG: exo-alpha-sialidase [Bacteroidales bacterium]|nr:exo-alpha-sialidase [Bacteroidales bacterium]
MKHISFCILALLLIFSCKKESDSDKQINPVSDFSFNIDTTKYPTFFVNFTNKSKDADKYLWDFGDGNSSSEANPIHKYTAAKEYTVKLTSYNKENLNVKSLNLTIKNIKLQSAELIALQTITIKSIKASSNTTVFDHIAFPDIARLGDGRFIVVFRQGTQHDQYGKGRIMKSFGSADGLNWTEPEILYDDPNYDDRDFSINRLSDSRLAGSFFKHGTNETSICFSSDEGQSWSEPKGYNNLGGWSYPSTQIVEIGDELWLATYGKSSNTAKYPKSRVIMYKSSDKGSNWTAEMIAPDNFLGYDLQEPAIILLSNNRILMHTRVATGAAPYGLGNMVQCYSNDLGKTWTKWQSFDFVGHAPELYKIENGVVISAFRWITADATQTKTALIYSIDEGNKWSDLVTVSLSDAECGYPSIESLGNNKFIVVFYQTVNDGLDMYYQIKAQIYQCNATFSEL